MIYRTTLQDIRKNVAKQMANLGSPSGKQTKNYGKSSVLMGKSTIFCLAKRSTRSFQASPLRPFTCDVDSPARPKADSSDWKAARRSFDCAVHVHTHALQLRSDRIRAKGGGDIGI